MYYVHIVELYIIIYIWRFFGKKKRNPSNPTWPNSYLSASSTVTRLRCERLECMERASVLTASWKIPMASWKIPVFLIGNASSNGCFSIVMLVFGGCNRK